MITGLPVGGTPVSLPRWIPVVVVVRGQIVDAGQVALDEDLLESAKPEATQACTVKTAAPAEMASGSPVSALGA
jgi:hypothetical protein